MCFATAAIVAATGGAAIKAIGDIEGGEAAKNEANYKAQVATNNSVIAKQNAAYASEAGQSEAEKIGMRNANVAGKVKTSQAANGVDVNSGSAVDVQTGQREAGQQDVLTAENNALLQAYGYNVQSSNYKAQSGLDTAEGEQAEVGGYFGAGGDLLSSASSIGTKWKGMQNPEPGGP